MKPAMVLRRSRMLVFSMAQTLLGQPFVFGNVAKDAGNDGASRLFPHEYARASVLGCELSRACFESQLLAKR